MLFPMMILSLRGVVDVVFVVLGLVLVLVVLVLVLVLVLVMLMVLVLAVKSVVLVTPKNASHRKNSTYSEI